MVRNESGNLPACLAGLQGAVDALYVTDTGSSDDTVAVAERLGALVRVWPWQGDFARARNASIQDVAEDWIFLLDADDRVDPSALAAIRPELKSDACAATLQYHVHPDYTPVRAVRFLRNRMNAEFQGVIHEEITGWLSKKVSEGWKCVDLDLSVVHTGYRSGTAAEKTGRNLLLLQQEWARAQAQPAGAVTSTDRWFYLGAELGLALAHAGVPDEGIRVLREVLSGPMAGREESAPPAALQALVNLLWVLESTGERTDALDVVRRAERLFSRSQVYALHRGLAELHGADWANALHWLQLFQERSAKAVPEIPVPRKYLGAEIWAVLGQCHMGLREFAAAAACLEKACQLAPQQKEQELRLLLTKRMMEP